MSVEQQLRDLIKERDAAFVYEDVYDEDLGKSFPQLTDEADKRVDELRVGMMKFMIANQDQLPVDLMLEAISSTGGAPTVINDDNGWWTIGGDGSQPLSPTLEEGFETRETEFSGVWWVEPGMWKRTIREALKVYLNKFEGAE